MLKEFKEFISRGNVVDLAVGIIIGAAFTAIVTSLVNDIIMPPVGMLIGGIDFSNFFINLSGTHYDNLDDAKKAGAATINYGKFINEIVRFFIVSFAVFILVKQVNRMRRVLENEKDAAPAAPPPRSEALLEEIRDLLKNK